MRADLFPGRKGHSAGQHRADRGIVMMVALVLMTGLIFVAATSAIRATRETQVTAVELDNTRTFYAAEGAVEYGSGELKTLLESTMVPTTEQLNSLVAPTLYGFTVNSFQITKVGGLISELISAGDYSGLNGYVQRYSVQARVSSPRRSATIVREIQHQFIPLFQFGVFYEKDLEIFPGANMTFVGPIHTNGSLYMGTSAQINCNSKVTAVGKFWHKRKDMGCIDEPGPVYIKDRLSVWQNVWRGSYWLDERRTDWAAQALTVWGGQVMDQAHGLSTLRLPLPPASDQHIIVERWNAADGALERESKYYYKATLRYIDGVLKDTNGTVLSHPGVYTYTANKFYDQREAKWMDVVEIDVAAMISGNYKPPNGILYISNYMGDAACVRIKNATTLPTGGLTIATDLPMYIKGNYNSTAKKGSALLSDAITLLSPAWNDANSSLGLGSRIPTALTVNACVMTGHVPTDSASTYSGGLENNFRFLEDWSGVTVTYRGSVIDLWYSRRATANWVYGSPRYNAPTRNWGYDTDLLSPSNWPPGTPKVQTIQRGTWRQIS